MQKGCLKQMRLRAGTMLDRSKVSLLHWTRALFHMMQGKRGVSALELKRHLGMRSSGTVWGMLHKIREALQQKDDAYKLGGTIELDGAIFGRRETGNQTEVLVAVETKDFVDGKGRPKSKAGLGWTRFAIATDSGYGTYECSPCSRHA